jgi:hypothetical protein
MNNTKISYVTDVIISLPESRYQGMRVSTPRPQCFFLEGKYCFEIQNDLLAALPDRIMLYYHWSAHD